MVTDSLSTAGAVSLPDGLASPEETTVEDLELLEEILWADTLLALLARLLRSLRPPLSVELDPTSLPVVGLSKSNPNCSKDRLKDVAFAGRVR